MKPSLTCKHCGVSIRADNEDELVARVQAHARTHDRPVELMREHVLARLPRRRDEGSTH